MKASNLTPAQITEVFQVLNNGRQGAFKSGWIRVKGLSAASVKWLKSQGFIAKEQDGKYYPKLNRSTLYPIFSLDWSWLPVDFLWHVVAPMLTDDGHAGYSITRNKAWGLLNLYSNGQHGYTDAEEERIMRVLGELSAYGYIWFQFGGSVWCITKRTDETAANTQEALAL